jgi:surfeit locus 1 family protein
LSEARPRSIVVTSIAALIVFAILCSLGVWQIGRKAWKEGLIATLDARLKAAPQPLPSDAHLAQDADEFRRVALRVTFVPGQNALVFAAPSAFRPDVTGIGYWVLSPARRDGGNTVVVDRGFIPASQKESIPAAPAGAVDIVGVVRWPESSGLFTPAPDVAHGIWYARDLSAIASAKGWGPVAPFSIEQESPQLPGAPRVGRVVVNLPNNHLQYVITWFGLAAALLGVYAVWLAGRLRGRA